jgi:hypothetical protein
MAGLGSWSGRKSDGLNWRQRSRPIGSIFWSSLAWRRRSAGGRAIPGGGLVVLPHCVTRQQNFVLLCQLAQGGEQLSRLELEARQLPQTRKDKFGWQFHDLVYGRFLMPRCDVKHTTTQPVRSVASAKPNSRATLPICLAVATAPMPYLRTSLRQVGLHFPGTVIFGAETNRPKRGISGILLHSETNRPRG